MGNLTQAQINELRKRADWAERWDMPFSTDGATLRALLDMIPVSRFQIGDQVRKVKGKSWWEGTVVGLYSTEDTPDGVNVQMNIPNGPVQIYPASVLAFSTLPTPEGE